MLKGSESHPIPSSSSSGHLQTQYYSPSSSHQGFVSVRLESFQTRIHPIPSFSDHINRALPSNLPLKVWYVSLNLFPTPHPPYTIIWLPTKAERFFFPSNSAQTFVIYVFKFFQPRIHPIPSSGLFFSSNCLPSFRICAFGIFPDPRPPPILSSGSLHNSGSFLPSNCPKKSLASMRSEYSKPASTLYHPNL